MRAQLRALARRLTGRHETNADIDDELRSHLELRADDLERQGLPRAEAERRARVELGGTLRIREQVQDAMGGSFLDTLRQDVRYGVRMLTRTPAFTWACVGTLALCIGANAVVFAALQGLVLRPLEVPDPGSLYSVHRIKDESAHQSYPDFRDLRAQNHSFQDLAGFNIVSLGWDTGERPMRTWALATTSNYFDALGLQPALGRLYHDSDERGPESAPVVVLSHRFWQRQFGGDPGIVGKAVRLNRVPFTVVGVAPARFNGTLLFFAPDYFVPLVNQPQLEGASVLQSRASRWIFMMFGHLKPGVTRAQAAAEMDALDAELTRLHPAEHAPGRFKLARPNLYGDFLGGPTRAFLGGLMLLAALILLAGCANLASLFAARATDRAREIALRLALGAARGRVLRQLFTEAMLITFSGAALGVLGSVALLRALRDWNPFPQYPLNLPVAPDATLLVLAIVLAVTTGLAFGAVPVRQVLNTDAYAVLKAGPTRGSAPRTWFRDALLAIQIAICALLVTSSIVALRGLSRSLHAELGFQPENTLLVSTDPSMAGYRGERVPPLQRQLLDALTGIPGVEAVGSADWAQLTMGDGRGMLMFRESSPDTRPANAAFGSVLFKVTPGYVAASRTALVAGRDFTTHDDAHAPRVALVNAEFARRMFGGEHDVVGRRFRQRDGALVEVVGLVADGRYEKLTEPRLPAAYFPLAQSPSPELNIVLRSSLPPAELAGVVRARIAQVDAALPVFQQTWLTGMSLVFFPARVATAVLGVLGTMAALLSITGVFGLAAYTVSRRRREIGIRVALGADRHDVLHAILGRSFVLLGAGSLAGVVLGLLASRVLASIVFEATPRDPLVLASVVAVMLVLGLAATWIPARRALAVNPLVLLREE